jgi:hypothetical protein
MTTRLEERERMVADLSELNEMNRLLITRYQEYEDREAEVDDEENKSIVWSNSLKIDALSIRK